MLVSAIMPAYNAAATIEESIRSVLAQTHQELELVVVDDGSTDETAAVIQRIASTDPRVRYIYQPNQRVVAARNRAIEQATGELVALLDADDAWRPDKLEKQLAARNGDADVVVLTGLQRFTEENGIKTWGTISVPPPPVAERYTPASLLLLDHFQFVLMNTALMPRAALLAAGGFKGWTGHDWDMWIELAKRCRFRVLPEVLFEYRKHASSVTAANDKLRTLEQHESIIRFHCAQLGCSSRFQATAMVQRQMSVCSHFLYTGETDLAWKVLRRSLRQAFAWLEPSVWKRCVELLRSGSGKRQRGSA
jgi:glycosyltransferase involved in cell wall biosynthesis